MALADFSLAGKKAIVVGGRRNMGKGLLLVWLKPAPM